MSYGARTWTELVAAGGAVVAMGRDEPSGERNAGDGVVAVVVENGGDSDERSGGGYAWMQ